MSGERRLDGHPFSYARRSDGTVIISYHAAPVTALRGTTAARFLGRLERADDSAAQHLMARATERSRRPTARRPARDG